MESFKAFYDRYKNKVYFFIKKYVENESDIEDITQEVFIHIWKYSSHKNSEEKLDQIVYKSAKQEIANFYRKKAVQKTTEFIDTDLPISLGDNITDDEAHSSAIIKINFLIEKLPEKTKEIFIKNKIENKSYSALAEKYQVSKTTIENHIKKATRYVKSNLLTLSTIFAVLERITNALF